LSGGDGSDEDSVLEEFHFRGLSEKKVRTVRVATKAILLKRVDFWVAADELRSL
jgi:hypothetical protein